MKALCTQTVPACIIQRLRISAQGMVQGVGFRPFVYRLAVQLGLFGWINNSASGVNIEVEGEKSQLDIFLLKLQAEKPPQSSIDHLEYSFLEPQGYSSFNILESEGFGNKTSLILPDFAICPECLKEILSPINRRYLYPFTNCTNCGPRFTIMESIPYDRVNTSMKRFAMCPQCAEEYHDPANRRFHAQPNACPVCGPHLELWDGQGGMIATHHEALSKAVGQIKAGGIVALKGLGGFQLLVDARNDEAIRRLRMRKHREEKPFAVMSPTMVSIKMRCEVSALEEQLLRSAAAPIVLLKAKETYWLAPSVAPGNPYLGAMLPYTPLHHILMKELGFPIIATSGNLSDEPICTDEFEALKRLQGIADVFLVHDRPIVRAMDDSVVRVVMGKPMVLRRARGYAPLPVHREDAAPAILAVGGHLKNTVALSVKDNIFISQHIGDLETVESTHAFQQTVKDLPHLYESTPVHIACDQHPEYLSTKYAREKNISLIPVQHHHAHVVACMAEHHLTGSVLGVSWDGTGFGTDGTIWGGEFLLSTLSSFKRTGHFRTFCLPGGEQAVKEPRRSALGVLYEMFQEKTFQLNNSLTLSAFSSSELVILKKMLANKLNSPVTSSAGRLFDAVASLVGLHQQTNFEGQAAMGLEYILQGIESEDVYPFNISKNHESFIIDWFPLIQGVIDDCQKQVSVQEIAVKFHNSLVEMIVGMAKKSGEKRVILSGGCFQNKYLTERAIRRLREETFEVFWPQQIPPNDGGISLGQIVVAANKIKETV